MTQKSLFQWGMSTLGAPAMTLAEVVGLMHRYQLDKLEIRTLEGTCDIGPILNRPENLALLQQLSDAGSLVSLDSGARISAPDFAIAELQVLAALADRFGVRYLRVFPGIDFHAPITDEVVATSLRNLDAFDRLGSKCRLALETHDGYSSAARCLEFFARTGRELPIIWDVQHTFYAGGESFAQSLDLLTPERIVSIHIKDLRFAEKRCTVPGEGELPIPELLELLRERNLTDIPLMFEYEKMWAPYLPDITVALDALNRLWRL